MEYVAVESWKENVADDPISTKGCWKIVLFLNVLIIKDSYCELYSFKILYVLSIDFCLIFKKYIPLGTLTAKLI